MRAFALVAAGLILAFSAVACDSGGASSSATTSAAPGTAVSPDALNAAVAKTEAAGTVNFDTLATVKGTPLGDQDVKGNGAADFASKLATVDGQLLGQDFTAVTSDGKVYVKSTLLGAGWYSIPASTLGAGQLLSQQLTDPARLFDLLKNVSGQVQLAGTEKIRGTQTTHYRATVDLATVSSATGASPVPSRASSLVPVDVWVDPQGLIARMAIDYGGTAAAATATATGNGSSGISVALTVDCTAYGQKVTITPPAASDVKDLSQSTLGSLGSLGGNSRR